MVIKKIIILSAAALSLLISGWLLIASRSESYSLRETNLTDVSFEQTEIDMGELKQGQPQSASFGFKNVGEHPLVMQHVEASCGCTEPQWPNKPVKPGEEAEITVTYDAKLPGRFFKSIQVFGNIEENRVELLITGEVLIQ